MREFNNNHISFWKVNASLTFAILPHLRTISLSGIVLNRTIHHGWTLHWAPEQPASQPARAAWTVSYFADGARILQTKHARYDSTHICFTPNSYALLSFLHLCASFDLSFNSMGHFVRRWPPNIFHWLFCIQYQQLR